MWNYRFLINFFLTIFIPAKTGKSGLLTSPIHRLIFFLKRLSNAWMVAHRLNLETFFNHLGGNTSYDGLYREIPPKTNTCSGSGYIKG